MVAERFVRQLSSVRFDNTFNPYSDRCEIHDYCDAPENRCALLMKMLGKAIEVEVDAIWVGRDLGYRGGRRTGLALTDDVHLINHVNRWGLTYSKFTKGTAVRERTASVIWQALSKISSPIFLWNVFPLHPYEPGEPFSNRTHNPIERKAGEEILDELVRILNPKRLVAVGNDAAKSTRRYGDSFEHFKVRHPSYGGQKLFLEQIKSIYSLNYISSTAE